MTDFEIKQLFAKSDQALAELVEQQKETAGQMKDTDAKLERMFAETAVQMKGTDRKLESMGIHLGGIGRNLGHFAESSFVSSLEKNKILAGVKFDFVHANMKGFDIDGVEREYDIVLQNGSVMAVMEVKFRLHPDDVEKFATKNLPKFREIFALAKDKKLIGAVASPSMSAESIARAKEFGLAVLTQEGSSTRHGRAEIKVLADDVRAY